VETVGRSRLRITEAGQKDLGGHLGLPPSARALPWPTLRNTYLVARALGLPAPRDDTQRRRLADKDGLRAAIFWARYDLPFHSYPSLPEARNALLWQQLLSDTTMQRLQTRKDAIVQRPFTQPVLMGILLNDLLAAPRELDWPAALAQLAAKLVGAQRITPDELRSAILRGALHQSQGTGRATPHPNDGRSQSDAIDYPAFAREVLQAAAACRTGRFGDHKVFISHVWERWRADGKHRQYDLPAFKQHLVEANRRRLLTLSRADLPQVMDPNDVAASEIVHQHDSLHFVRLD
jgi:hypothetical protein